MPLYVAVDIGCLECGEMSSVLGIFMREEDAYSVIEDHRERQNEAWHGEHSFRVFCIEELNRAYPVDY